MSEKKQVVTVTDRTRTRKPPISERVIAGLDALLASTPVSFQSSVERAAAIQYLTALVAYCKTDAYRKKRSDISQKTRDWHLNHSGRVITPRAVGRRRKKDAAPDGSDA